MYSPSHLVCAVGAALSLVCSTYRQLEDTASTAQPRRSGRLASPGWSGAPAGLGGVDRRGHYVPLMALVVLVNAME